MSAPSRVGLGMRRSLPSCRVCRPAEEPDAREVISLIKEEGRIALALPGDLRSAIAIASAGSHPDLTPRDASRRRVTRRERSAFRNEGSATVVSLWQMVQGIAMLDDLTKRASHGNKVASHGTKFLSLETDWEAEYWAKRFGVSVECLKEAVAAVGHSVATVGAYLNEDAVAYG
jgi:hypothetical protein